MSGNVYVCVCVCGKGARGGGGCVRFCRRSVCPKAVRLMLLCSDRLTFESALCLCVGVRGVFVSEWVLEWVC